MEMVFFVSHYGLPISTLLFTGKAILELPLMIGDAEEKAGKLEQVKAVLEVWLELLVREVLGRLLGKEMLMGGELQEPGGGEEQELDWLRGKDGGAEIGESWTLLVGLVILVLRVGWVNVV